MVCKDGGTLLPKTPFRAFLRLLGGLVRLRVSEVARTRGRATCTRH